MKKIEVVAASSRAQSVIESSKTLTEDAARRQKITRWIDDLKTAEAAAKARQGASRRTYLVSYRIKDVTRTKTGTYDQRRDALVELLESLPLTEKHLSTSTWLLELYIQKAADLLSLLKAPLATVDFLSVAEITANRAKFGDADLE